MKKKVYIDGNFLHKDGVFFGLDFCAYANESHKNSVDEIINCEDNGIYEVTEDNGSMFTYYYVKGGITSYGQSGSDIWSFLNVHENTYTKFKHIQEQIVLLLENVIIPNGCKNLFYQQQFISLYANFEFFLYNTFMWETCQCYDSYKKVIELFASNDFNIKNTYKKIFIEEHNILQERTFIKCIKDIVYRQGPKVKCLYKTAFGIDIEFEVLENAYDIRNDIAHRAGYTKEGNPIIITKEQVLSLKDKIEGLVESITQEIAKFNNSKN